MKDIVHFISDIRTTGAIMPSSRFLVDAAVDQLREHMRRNPSSSVRILDLGPGTGVFTKALVSAQKPKPTPKPTSKPTPKPTPTPAPAPAP
jgi:phospholipid N-methyltransferase